jgi:SAM-dependent methyltransferase
MREAFENIYNQNLWGFESGHGSAPSVTRQYRTFVERFIRESNVRSIVDLGCGDWQFSRLIDWQGANYVGVDIVPSVVDENRRRFATDNIRFELAGERFSELPAADLLLAKDVLQHWSTDDVKHFLAEALAKYRAALITNCIEPRNLLNTEIPSGEFRPVDLRLPPFNLAAECVLTFEGPAVFSQRTQRQYPAWRKAVLLHTRSSELNRER